MLSDNAKIIIGLLAVLAILYYINSSNSPIQNAGSVKSQTNVKASNNAYPDQVYEDSGNYAGNTSKKPSKAPNMVTDDEWEKYFNNNNSVTGKAQIRDNPNGYRPVDSTGGQYASYDIPVRKNRTKVTPSKLPDGSFDPDMYDPDNLLPQEEDADWFEVIDKPINLKGRLLRLENPLGINTINESLKIPNLDLRPSPPCPKMNVSPWLNSTVEPDTNIKSLY
jgi:hypothetical protein